MNRRVLILNWHQSVLWSMVALFVCAVAMPAMGQDVELSERNQQRLWHQHWREFGKFYVEHEGKFVCFPKYDTLLHNSSGKTAREYEKESEQAFDLGRNGGVVTLDKPQGEVDAVTRLLPAFEPGSYGYIHSGMVDEIVNGQTLRLKQVWLLDGEATRDTKRKEQEEFRQDVGRDFQSALRNWRRGGRAPGGRDPDILGRAMGINEAIDWRYEKREELIELQTRNGGAVLELQGFDTSRLFKDKRWPAGNSVGSVQVAIVEVSGGGGFLNTDKRITAVSASALRKGLDEEQFKKMLASRKLTDKQFVQLVFDAKKADGREYRQSVLASIEGWESQKPDLDNTEVRDLVGEKTDVDTNKKFE